MELEKGMMFDEIVSWAVKRMNDRITDSVMNSLINSFAEIKIPIDSYSQNKLMSTVLEDVVKGKRINTKLNII